MKYVYINTTVRGGNDKIVPLIVNFIEDGEKRTQEFNIKDSGKPVDNNLAKWVWKLMYSYLPGQVNDHITKSNGGFPPYISKAIIVDQKTGRTLTKYMTPKLPSFATADYIIELIKGRAKLFRIS